MTALSVPASLQCFALSEANSAGLVDLPVQKLEGLCIFLSFSFAVEDVNCSVFSKKPSCGDGGYLCNSSLELLVVHAQMIDSMLHALATLA